MRAISVLAIAATGCSTILGLGDVHLIDGGGSDSGVPTDVTGSSTITHMKIDGSTCGDGIYDALAGEQCDDGNKTGGDGCSSTCQVEAGYTCDNSVSPSKCTN